MQLEPNDLLLFARVVEEGSFSRAAQQLGVPISTVSRRITALETQLNERLLLRTTRKLTVTELGLALLQHARQVVEGVDAAASLADHRQVQPSGRLRISMPPDLAFLAPVIADFLSAYPSIRIEIDVSVRLVDLIAESFDVALRYGQLRDDATLAARRVTEVRGSLYASPAYLKAHGTPKEPEALLQHTVLHLASREPSEPIPWVLARGKARWQGEPPGRVVVNSPEFRIRMAVHGAGIAPAELSVADPYVKAGRLTCVLPDWELPRLTLWAVFLGRKLMPARTRVFLDALVSAFGSPGKS